MVTKCIVVADASRARIFHADMTPGARLEEIEDLVLPAMSKPQHERYEGSRPARQSHAPSGGYGLEDNRERHDLELKRVFAGEVARAAFARAGEVLVLVAPPKMLGMIRPIAEELGRVRGTKVETLAQELTKVPPHDLAEHLRGHGILR
jgi:protein required for attachment to host cells